MEEGGSESEKVIMEAEVKKRKQERLKDTMLLALNMEKEARSLRRHGASRNWKRQGNEFFPGASRRNAVQLIF